MSGRIRVTRGGWETALMLGGIMGINVASDAAFSSGWFGPHPRFLLRFAVPLSATVLMYCILFGLRWWRLGFVFHDPRE
jgi:hypothetical protein